jgi:hypothetical protein
MRTIFGAAIIALAAAGCAKDANQVGATYVSPVMYETYTCPQLAQEAQRGICARCASRRRARRKVNQ